MPVSLDYSRIDGALALACDEADADERSLTVFVHAFARVNEEQSKRLEMLGVKLTETPRRIFTATISPSQVAALSHEPWIKHLKLSQRLKMAGQ